MFSPSLDPAVAEVAIDFATALVEGEYARAHGMLTPEAQARISPMELQQTYLDMVNIFGSGASARVAFDPQFTMRNWPGKLPLDRGWVYVSIAGEDFVEAVSLIIQESESGYGIREIEWGRP